MPTTTTENKDTSKTQGTTVGAGRVVDWLRPSAAVERLQRYNHRVGAVSEEVMERGVAAFESLSRLTRDNLAAGRVVANQWRDLGLETMRRQSELLTPTWLR